MKLERVSGEMVFEVVPERGRLHVQVSSGKSQDSENELLALNLTARGQVIPNNPTFTLESGIELGHRVIVEMFSKMASESAQKFWGRKDFMIADMPPRVAYTRPIEPPRCRR